MVTMQRDVSAPIEHMRLRSWRFGRDEEAQFHEPKFVGLYKTKINCKVNCTILYINTCSDAFNFRVQSSF
jgi:hypothetical protein